MTESGKRRIVLIGGGLGGALLAAMLGREGYEIDLYERRSDPSAGNFVGGRSINLAISTRGIHALKQVGLDEAVLAAAVPMRGRMIHAPDGSLAYQPYDRDRSRCINSVGRAALNRITLDAARALPNVRVHFNHRCTDVDLDRPAAQLVTDEPPADAAHSSTGSAGPTARQVIAAGDVLIGIDGAFSAVRRAMQRLDRFDYAQTFLAHGYKELCIPPTADGNWAMEPNALHIWPRRSFMMIALPNPDRSFTCTLFYPFEGPMSFASLRTDDDVRRLFETQFPDAAAKMPTLLADFRGNPTGSMVTVRCAPWVHAGRVALLGDAAHAVVPFYGQGANASFEDCAVLLECLRELGGDWPRVLEEYARRRKPNVDALADLAVANFVEMRDKTARASFRAYKWLDRTLHGLLPRWYTPLYTMVSFTRTPYAEAVRRARRQDRALAAIAVALAAVLVVAGGWMMM